MNGTAVRQDDFDALLLSELETLRASEKHLERLFKQLRKKPHLRESFLSELSDVQQHAERLDAVLNPLDIFNRRLGPFGKPILNPAA